ncbi:MAG: hypothetical protein K5923_00485 [Clostridia bacterium]|nr:hypothetical protein [Clostridia bacterium]
MKNLKIGLIIVVVILVCLTAFVGCAKEKQNEETGTKYVGALSVKKSGMPFAINYSVEFYLYEDGTYKSITTYKVVSSETTEEKGTIDFKNLTITPNDKEVMEDAVKDVVYDDNGKITSLSVNVYTSADKDARNFIELKIEE